MLAEDLHHLEISSFWRTFPQLAAEICSDRGCRHSCSLLTVEASPRAEAANPRLQVITKHQARKSQLMRSHPVPWDDVCFSTSKASQTRTFTSQRPVEGTPHPLGSWPLAAPSVLQGFSFPPFESPDSLHHIPPFHISHLAMRERVSRVFCWESGISI